MSTEMKTRIRTSRDSERAVDVFRAVTTRVELQVVAVVDAVMLRGREIDAVGPRCRETAAKCLDGRSCGVPVDDRTALVDRVGNQTELVAVAGGKTCRI